jgi:hypothetical protein
MSQSLTERFMKPKQGWVFNPWLDIICFYVPIFAGAIWAIPSLTSLPFLKTTFDSSHLFVTLFPVLLLRRSPTFNTKGLFVRTFLHYCFFATLCFWNIKVFTYVVGYYLLFHVLSQFYGWLVKLQRFEPDLDKKDIFFEKAFLLLMILSALMFWHTGFSSVVRSYTYKNNLTAFDIHPTVWQAVNILYYFALGGMTLRWGYNTYRKKYFPAGKALYLLAIWLIFYWSIVFNKSRSGIEFFWFALILNHGLAYIIHIFPYYKKINLLPSEKFDTSGLVYLVFLVVSGYSWNTFIHWFMPQMVSQSAAALLFATPVLIHCAIDGVIWRKPAKLLSS